MNEAGFGLIMLTIVLGSGLNSNAEVVHQYHHDNIQISPANPEEPFLESWSIDAALSHLDQGAKAWTESKQCISCHTNGSYMLFRPALSSIAGPPDLTLQRFFHDELETLEKQGIPSLLKGIQPTQLAYLAAGLASWDRHLTGSCTPETDRALRLMFKAQSNDGSFGNDDCWPPLESSSYHAATVAATAVASAPDWLSRMSSDAELGEPIEKLENYLKNTPPPHAYAQILLWSAAYYWPDLQKEGSKKSLMALVQALQQEDGGWALRSFAAPEEWGNGGRAQRLQDESEFDKSKSDGHMTGLICMILRQYGFSSSNPVLSRGLKWLKSHQRVSGRWWTRSLNTDRFHFITYSGTCYALMALALPE